MSGLDLPFTFLDHGIFLRTSLLLESYSPERQFLLLNTIVIVTESEEGTMVQLCIAHPLWQILSLLFQLILLCVWGGDQIIFHVYLKIIHSIFCGAWFWIKFSRKLWEFHQRRCTIPFFSLVKLNKHRGLTLQRAGKQWEMEPALQPVYTQVGSMCRAHS